MRRAQNADTHALKQPRLSQNISPVCPSFALVIAFDMHLESESEKRWFTHSWKHPDTTNTFPLVLDEFLSNDLRPIDCSLTSWATGCWSECGKIADVIRCVPPLRSTRVSDDIMYVVEDTTNCLWRHLVAAGCRYPSVQAAAWWHRIIVRVVSWPRICTPGQGSCNLIKNVDSSLLLVWFFAAVFSAHLSVPSTKTAAGDWPGRQGRKTG